MIESLAWASSKPPAGHGVVVLGESVMKKEGLALVWKAGMAILSTTTTKTETDTSSKVVVRALLAPSRQANGWVDRPVVGLTGQASGLVFGQVAGNKLAGECGSGR